MLSCYCVYQTNMENLSLLSCHCLYQTNMENSSVLQSRTLHTGVPSLLYFIFSFWNQFIHGNCFEGQFIFLINFFYSAQQQLYRVMKLPTADSVQKQRSLRGWGGEGMKEKREEKETHANINIIQIRNPEDMLTTSPSWYDWVTLWHPETCTALWSRSYFVSSLI